MKVLRHVRDVMIGRSGPRAGLRAILLAEPSIVKGVKRFESDLIEGDVPPEDSPVFIFSAGWRSGSTLLQRLVTSSGDVFVWGEPYDHSELIQSLARTMTAFSHSWPPTPKFYNGETIDTLSNRWIATLYPSCLSLLKGHRAVFETTFAKPALASGANRWGIKEVRLDIGHAHYLKLLYPSAKFLFLYRNPYESYRSYRNFGARWYLKWPSRPIFTPREFGRVWENLTSQFVEQGESFGGFVLSYEDLLSDQDLRVRLEEYLCLKPDWDILDSRIDGRGDLNESRKELSFAELLMLNSTAGRLARKLGYTSNSH